MKHRVQSWIEGGRPFEQCALELWAWQVQHSPAYAALCGDIRPSVWQEIPAVPVALFKDVVFSCVSEAERLVRFQTSGTTEGADGKPGRRGTHWLPDTDLYDLLSKRHAEAVVGPIPGRCVSLVPHDATSSLGHMVSSFCDPVIRAFKGGVQHAALVDALGAPGEPVFVAATAFAMAEALRHAASPWPLPTGSVVMITGGFKGRVMQIDEAELGGRVASAFPGASLVGEYGMTELSSQLWSPRLGDPFVPPPWMRVLAVDPWSGAPVAGPGLLRFFDLVNHASVLAIETQDVGEVLDDGRVVLHGRLPGAEARGCSLTVEEALRLR